MEEFITKHLTGVFLTQLCISVGALVKLWFNFQTLKRDFEKKEKDDKEGKTKLENELEKHFDKIELDEKEEKLRFEKGLEKNFNKIEKKLDSIQNTIESTKKDLYNTDKALTEQITILKAELNVYGRISSSFLEKMTKNGQHINE